MKPELLLELLKELEKEDPIDFSGLPFDENDLRQLACLNVVEIINQLDDDATEEDKELLMAVTVAKLVLENMVLHARLSILMQE
ncbi:hypothetical protein [Methyloradius palustris]|uniref:Uncharacterized protein n=1 Tax=Methyloradius palustris TaxID=2778876 RepID=A0A8D5JS00_9PROT|nr:hypothetical protein [Methyloradius palustris]BCM25961.1 hypothetical protein ZMTM_22200 [Methyloradius palustris]